MRVAPTPGLPSADALDSDETWARYHGEDLAGMPASALEGELLVIALALRDLPPTDLHRRAWGEGRRQAILDELGRRDAATERPRRRA